MSITEMKLHAISEITKMETEKELQELVAYLSAEKEEAPQLNLARHFDEVVSQYGETLARLAQ